MFNAQEFKCLNVVLNVKAVVAAFNQEKAFSMITNLRVNLQALAGADHSAPEQSQHSPQHPHSTHNRSLLTSIHHKYLSVYLRTKQQSRTKVFGRLQYVLSHCFRSYIHCFCWVVGRALTRTDQSPGCMRNYERYKCHEQWMVGCVVKNNFYFLFTEAFLSRI